MDKKKPYDIKKDPYLKFVTKFEDAVKDKKPSIFKKVGAKFNFNKVQDKKLKKTLLDELENLKSRLNSTPNIPIIRISLIAFSPVKEEPEEENTLFDVFEEKEHYLVTAETGFKPLKEAFIYNPFGNEVDINDGKEHIILDLSKKAEIEKMDYLSPDFFSEVSFLNGVYTFKMKKREM